MAKAPADQFYFGDYIRDTRSLSLDAKGAWMDILAHSFFMTPQGRISQDLDAWSRMFGCTVEKAKTVLNEISRLGIGDIVTNSNGIVTVTNRRKFNEWCDKEGNKTRQSRYRARIRGTPEGDVLRNNNGDVTAPSSSSSSSSSSSDTSYRAETAADTDPVHRRIWNDGVDLLMRDGKSKDSARSLLGRYVKQYGKPQVAVAIAVTQAENAADTTAFLIGVLKKRDKDRAAMQVGKWDGEPGPEPKCGECFDLGWTTEPDPDGPYSFSIKTKACVCGQPWVQL